MANVKEDSAEYAFKQFLEYLKKGFEKTITEVDKVTKKSTSNIGKKILGPALEEAKNIKEASDPLMKGKALGEQYLHDITKETDMALLRGDISQVERGAIIRDAESLLKFDNVNDAVMNLTTMGIMKGELIQCNMDAQGLNKTGVIDKSGIQNYHERSALLKQTPDIIKNPSLQASLTPKQQRDITKDMANAKMKSKTMQKQIGATARDALRRQMHNLKTSELEKAYNTFDNIGRVR